MDKTTKAIINLKEGIIELEGSEAFVRQYLDDLKSQIVLAPKSVPNAITGGVVSKNHGNDSEVAFDKKKEGGSKRKIKDIKPEKFDIDASGDIPSLKDFIDQKQPGTVAKNRIAVIAYYLSIHKDIAQFTEGHIDYAYRALSLNKRPIHMRQILINLKNENMWFEEGATPASWKTTRVCESFVDDQLPPKISKKEE